VPDTTIVPARPWYPIGKYSQLAGSAGESGRNSLPTFSA
jgi:hypothetical protein